METKERMISSPRYQKVAIGIAQRIVDGKFPLGQKIKSRSTLASYFNVSPETARKAINVLADLDIVSVRQGSGVIVISRDKAIEYIAKTPQVRDVLLSGGDALLVSDKKLEEIIKKLRAIPHVEIIRIGSRTPVVLPQRITPELCNMLKKYHPMWLNAHFNHPQEVTPEAKKACEMLADAGIPLGNQTVLLRGVNDSVPVMKRLVHDLVMMRVRPYYIYQCDLSMGLEHFRTPVSKGIEIIEGLRGHTSGYAVPTFVVDAPGGGGKTPVMPQYVISQSPGRVVLRNFEGVITTYTEPENYTHEPCYDEEKFEKMYEISGVYMLDEGLKMSLEPSHLARHERNKKRAEAEGKK